MSSTDSPPFLMKHWFDAVRYRAIARDLSELAPGFDRRRFLQLTLDGLDDRELMDRMRQMAIAIDATLPGTYRKKLAVVRALARRIKHGFVGVALCDFVARAGLADFDASMDALRFLTRFGSAEFAVRPFLLQDQDRTLAVMTEWARDPDEHVRRLASEGCRPRLPWGQRLPALMRDPAPLAPILDALKGDDSLYVRKSVANNLNDVSKDHPGWVLDRIETWDLASPHLAWIARRALRTLIKRGDPRALAVLGAGRPAAVKVRFVAQPVRIRLGDRVTFSATIASTSRTTQRLVIDYVVHYVRAAGATSAKVFKWTELDLPARTSATMVKRQTIRDFSTRRHVTGRHAVELQINGRRVARTGFVLEG